MGIFSETTVWMVSQLNQEIAQTLDSAFSRVWVRGEVSNFVAASSGHWYFSLKDANGLIKAVMFRSRSQGLDFTPKVGDTVEVYAKPTIYAARGEIQLQVDRMRKAGLGALYERFLQIRATLEQQGYFAADRKLPLPVFVRRVGIVTSLQAAALQDVLTTLSRRTPHMQIVIYPCLVQGSEAAQSIRQALKAAEQHQWADVLLLVRGGGSMEDLWPFNDPDLAQTLAHHPIPIISGIGHETDTTIADFVVSKRAPTPTAAAELLGFETSMWQQTVGHLIQKLGRSVVRYVQQKQQAIDYQERLLVSPSDYVLVRRQHLEMQWLTLRQRLASCWRSAKDRMMSWQNRKAIFSQIHQQENHLSQGYDRLRMQTKSRLREYQVRLQHAQARLQAFNPHNVLNRGYAIVMHGQKGVIHHADQLQAEEQVQITLARGSIVATVQSSNSDAG